MVERWTATKSAWRWRTFALKLLLVLVIVSMPGAFWAYMRRRLEWGPFFEITIYTVSALLALGSILGAARWFRHLVMRR